MTPNKKCKTCSSTELVNETLFCRLNPPQVTILLMPMHNALGEMTGSLQTLASQPSVRPDDWCSKWTPEFKLRM